ncbi:MAG: hypothetical protein K8I02_10240, partial [Candidatus Methylomirabilis sp.]|nr:hypothetical protein [Deltaproteobacteria bacterium]
WVEYANAPADGSNPDWCGGPGGPACPAGRENVDWAARRAANGHPAPYGVKYWELGVETRLYTLNGLGLNAWQDYAKKFAVRARAMRAIDPTVRLGAVGWDAPLNRTQFADWTTKVAARVAEHGERIDFWQFHSYAPGAGLLLRGVELRGDGAGLEIEADFPASGAYAFELYATGTVPPPVLFQPAPPAVRPDFRALIDGVEAARFSLPVRRTDLPTSLADNKLVFNASVSAGRRRIRVEKVSGNAAEAYPFFSATPAGGAARWLDLKGDPAAHYLLQAGVMEAGASFRAHDAFAPAGGRIPVGMTEFNVEYEPMTKLEVPYRTPGVDLREALGLWTYLQQAVRNELELSVVHQLFHEGWYGLVEGVTTDHTNGGALGREDVRKRPTFHALKMMRDGLLPVRVEAAVSSPSALVPRTGGLRMGLGGLNDVAVPLVDAIATRSEDGATLSLLLVNRDHAASHAVTVSVAGFGPVAPTGEMSLLTSHGLEANNEPEPASCSDPRWGCPVTVETLSWAQSGAAESFTIPMPKHSMVAVKLFRAP